MLAACDRRAEQSPFLETGELIALSGGQGGPRAACVTCHGLHGEGDGRDAPALAGRDAGYLHRQIDDYARGTREHEAMRLVASRLREVDRARVTAYYAAMPLPVGSPEDQPVNQSASRLYTAGDDRRGIQACADCHGSQGEGGDAANPPLAGQPAVYLERQLHAWRDGRRHSDPLGQMLAISRLLSAQEVRDLAAHAAGLPGQRPPVVQEASLSERHADPRNDASEPRQRGVGSGPRAAQ